MADLVTEELFEASDEDMIDEEEAFNAIMERLLSRVPTTLDTREGSVIYNALAPAAWEIQLLYEELQTVLVEAFADTANLDYLIRRAAERGITYKDATRAIVVGQFEPITIDVTGGRFTELESGISYIVTEKIEDGKYYMECETEGEEGNLSSGQLITDEVFDEEEDLTSAEIISLSNAASAAEDVEAFRQRYFDSIDSQAFGGNVADYKSKLLAHEKVGAVKVFPIWNGGGTVKIVFLNSSYSTPGPTVVDEIQTYVDPEQNQGEGKGFAPIGHVVTVEAAEEVAINISLTVEYDGDYSKETAEPLMTEAVEEYLLSVRREWGNGDAETTSVVRTSYIENKLLTCGAVLDVQVTGLNGSDKNIELEPEQVPVMGVFDYGISGTQTTD